jgi:hypothetical protein
MRKINTLKKYKMLERKEKWSWEKNGSKTFVISHFFLGTLEKSFSVLIYVYILRRSELNVFSILAFQIGVIHFYHHLPRSTFWGWTNPLTELWFEVMLALFLVKSSTKNVFWCAEVYWLMMCRMSRNWPSSEGGHLL